MYKITVFDFLDRVLGVCESMEPPSQFDLDLMTEEHGPGTWADVCRIPCVDPLSDTANFTQELEYELEQGDTR